MKITELDSNLHIALSNEEAELLERIGSVEPLSSFTDRDKVLISQLVRKSCLSKTVVNSSVMVVNNGSKND